MLPGRRETTPALQATPQRPARLGLASRAKPCCGMCVVRPGMPLLPDYGVTLVHEPVAPPVPACSQTWVSVPQCHERQLYLGLNAVRTHRPEVRCGIGGVAQQRRLADARPPYTTKTRLGPAPRPRARRQGI